jgi:hypothetical protein
MITRTAWRHLMQGYKTKKSIESDSFRSDLFDIFDDRIAKKKPETA